MFDPAYSQLLDTNQELRNELRDEISINKSYEKKIQSLVKELEQCYRTISLQDNTIIVHEKVIEKFKSEISDLRKQLRILQQDKKFKDEVGSIQDGRIVELENKVERLKVRIRILIDKKIPIDNLRNQLNDSGNQNLRLQRLLDESRTQAERITQMHTDALNNEMEARREYWQLAQNRQERIGELLRENFVYQLLIQRKDTQIAEHRRNAHRLTVRYNNDTERWRRRHIGCVRQAQNWKGQYRNSQNQVQARGQNILNLQGQILALQNNPLGNMADARRLPVLTMIAPVL